MKLVNCPESRKNISLVIIFIFISTFFTACTGSDNKELDQIKKDLEAYKSQVDVLKEENEKLKQQLSDLQDRAVSDISNSEEISSGSDTTLSEEYKTVSIGDTIVFSDVAEIVIDKCEFTKKVLPSKPDGLYSYYEAKDADVIFFHVTGKYKNLTTEEQDFDYIPIRFEAKYQEKYKYTGFKVAEENGGSDFDILAYAKPLTNLKFHVLIEVPMEVENNGNFDLYIFNGESKYKLKVK